MKNYVFAKITAVMTIILNVNSSTAQSLNLEDVKNMQHLLDKKVLVKTNGNLQLSESLKEAGLVEYLDSIKTTNCTGGGSCW